MDTRSPYAIQHHPPLDHLCRQTNHACSLDYSQSGQLPCRSTCDWNSITIIGSLTENSLVYYTCKLISNSSQHMTVSSCVTLIMAQLPYTCILQCTPYGRPYAYMLAACTVHIYDVRIRHGRRLKRGCSINCRVHPR